MKRAKLIAVAFIIANMAWLGYLTATHTGKDEIILAIDGIRLLEGTGHHYPVFVSFVSLLTIITGYAAHALTKLYL